ncbi:hypothetical protein MKW98_018109, partial [Papaver atlanticum]
ISRFVIGAGEIIFILIQEEIKMVFDKADLYVMFNYVHSGRHRCSPIMALLLQRLCRYDTA